MSSEELIRLKITNAKLVKTNRKLNEMLKLMESFRVLLISMVNNCKCNTESTIRIKFNLLMEDYYDFTAIQTNKSNDNSLNAIQTDDNCDQFDINFVVSDLLTDQSLNQTEDNSHCIDENDQNLSANEMIDTIEDRMDEQKRIEKEKHFDSMTKSEDGRDLDLCERIARLKRFVARPKIYSRLNKPRIRPATEFPCNWPGCDSVFKAKVDMKTHLWVHTGEKPYCCDFPGCNKRFPVKRNLARHRETHGGVKQFVCDWPGCEYKSWYPQGVRAHKKRHTDERPHKCQWPSCEWTFRQSHHLKAHLLKHTGEKPYICQSDGCEQKFQSKQAMKIHFERTHSKH